MEYYELSVNYQHGNQGKKAPGLVIACDGLNHAKTVGDDSEKAMFRGEVKIYDSRRVLVSFSRKKFWLEEKGVVYNLVYLREVV